MAGSPEILAAFRELTTAKQLDRAELLDLLRDGIQAALVRRYGPNVKFELGVDELQGAIRIVRLRQVVETVEDPAWQIAARGGALRGSRLPGRRHARGGRPLRGLRAAGGAGGQAADHPAGARGRAHPDPRRVRRQGGRAALRRDPADRARQAGHHAQQVPRGGGDHPLPRAESPRALPPGRHHPRRAQAARGDAQGPAPHPVPRRPALREGALQARGARDPAGRSSRSAPSRAKWAAAPRSPSSRATTPSTRSAPASASRAPASRRW